MARKSKGLPFVVQPKLKPITERIGTEESGIIEIIRRGYLNVAEKAIAQQATQGDDSIRAIYTLGGKIARAVGKPVAEVMNDMMRTTRPDYMDEYEEEILEQMIEMMAYQERVNLVQATSLIICRVDPGWTIEQSMELHPDLVRDLATLYNEEDQRSEEALVQAPENGGTGVTEGK